MKAIIGEFGDAQALLGATTRLRQQGFRPLDALTPVAVPELDEMIAQPARRVPVRVVMAVAGFGVAIFFYGLQWFSSAYAYPINSGGRPLNSWPIFLLVPFEVGVLAACIAGFVALLVRSGLPSLNHPAFDYPGIERASQDRFFLATAHAEDDEADERQRRVLFDAGALSVGEGEM